jgi:hypothetical protein
MRPTLTLAARATSGIAILLLFNSPPTHIDFLSLPLLILRLNPADGLQPRCLKGK